METNGLPRASAPTDLRAELFRIRKGGAANAKRAPEGVLAVGRVNKKDADYFFRNNDFILLKKPFLIGTDSGKGSFKTQGKHIL